MIRPCGFNPPLGDRVEIESDEVEARAKTPGLARGNGFSLHAGVAVPTKDRQRLERLFRYVGRPPVAAGICGGTMGRFQPFARGGRC
jgi:hypothetical protein